VILTGRLAIFVVAVAVWPLACSKATPLPKKDAVAVTLVLDWVPNPEFGGFYAAREMGAFASRGLDVTIQGGGAGTPVIQMVATGRAEFGVAGADAVIMARAHGAEVIPLFATFQTSPQAIMAHSSRAARTLGEVLRTGTLAVEPGLPYVLFLRKKYGPFGAAVLPYDGGVARFMADPSYAQQCFVTDEPIAVRSKGGDPQLFLVADEGYNPYMGVIVVGRSLLDKHPDRVSRFVDAAREGWTAYLRDPGSTNRLLVKLNPSLDSAAAAAAAAIEATLAESDATRVRGLGAMDRRRWETLGEQLSDLGVVEHAPPVEQYLLFE
jgi:NitT/TauT family transport system substrate-binding protein